ncbi:SsgA family sporulation/cell division regulator [Streptomyces sp. NPDC048385]|uniref:SsgA family sporulation/cell division regulator n=1 Tax=unclassified Streptomyces TaxID=2593676 RepID=UPI00343B90C8
MSQQQPYSTGGSPGEGYSPVLSTLACRLFAPLAPRTLKCRFRYSVGDPFAVSIDLMLAPDAAVTWVVARELLDSGTHRPSGEADFRVWPAVGGRGGRRLYFSLIRPDGHVTFESDLTEVRRWLDSTYRLVPAGSEAELLNWEALEAMLLEVD